MALCILAKEWKCRSGSEGKKNGFFEGILGVVVDHKLRPESTDEAHLVSTRLEKIGIRCEVIGCDWSDGKPKLGHLEEDARNKRYDFHLSFVLGIVNGEPMLVLFVTCFILSSSNFLN